MAVNRILISAAAMLAALAAPAHAQPQQGELNRQLSVLADLAEYLTSCGGETKPQVVKIARGLIARAGRDKWMGFVAQVHFARDMATTEKFCAQMGERLTDAGLIEIDFRPVDEITPVSPPAELDLTKVPRSDSDSMCWTKRCP
jgi:hypothetical protein